MRSVEVTDAEVLKEEWKKLSPVDREQFRREALPTLDRTKKGSFLNRPEKHPLAAWDVTLGMTNDERHNAVLEYNTVNG